MPRIFDRSIAHRWAALPLELILGTVFFSHGLQKLMDVQAFARGAIQPMGLPGIFVYLVILAEFGGALLLLLGLFVRLGAAGHILVMLGAISQVHWQNGLSGPGGFELPIVVLGGAIALLVLGADPLSIDRNLTTIELFTHAETVRNRREGLIPARADVRIAGLLLVILGILLPVGRLYLGFPPGMIPLAATVVAGLVSVVSGAGLFGDKHWAHSPGLIMARLYFGGGALLLLYIKYLARGSACLLVAFLILAILSNARQNAR